MTRVDCVWLAVLGFLLAPSPAFAKPRDTDAMIADARAAMLRDPKETIKKAAEIKVIVPAIADSARRDTVLATADWLDGEAHLRLGMVDAAAPLIGSALSRAVRSDPNSQLVGDALVSRGDVHGARGEVAASLTDYQRAHEIFRRNHNARSQSMALMSIALLYNDARDNKSALKYFDQAMETYSVDPNLEISVFNNRGGIYQDIGRYQQADAQFTAALSLARKLDSRMMQAQILGNLARNRLKAGEVARAEVPLREALALARGSEAEGWRGALLAIAAQAAFQRRDLPGAATLIRQSFAGVDPTQTTLSSREAHQTAYEVFDALGDKDAALVHLAALKRLDDRATRLATNASTALMAARFDYANQEVKIAKLNAEQARRSAAYERQRARTQRYVFLGAAGATAVLVGMLVFALVTSRRARVKVDAANADLAVTNQALGKALAAKTEFLATTSHEIRTPLNGILGMTQVMLADASMTPATRDRLELVHGAGVTMRALVDDILDVAKMETGNLTIEEADFDLCRTMTDATKLWEAQAQAKGLRFVVDLDDCPGMVCGDAARVRQIAFNLLSNAIKFTAAGEVRLTVARAGEGTVTIAVADSGIGIAADKQGEVFEAFRQADAGTTRQFGGTGLGLAICRNLVEAMGGSIALASRPGEGTTFTVTLPLRPSEAPSDAAGGSGPVRTDHPSALLVLDRNPITRSMFRTLLQPHAGTVLFAADADQAVAALRQGNCSALLIDDATTRIGGEPRAVLTRVADAARAAGVTAHLLWPVSAASEREELLATGVDQVISKPISGLALVAALYPGDCADKDDAPLVSRAA